MWIKVLVYYAVFNYKQANDISIALSKEKEKLIFYQFNLEFLITMFKLVENNFSIEALTRHNNQVKGFYNINKEY